MMTRSRKRGPARAQSPVRRTRHRAQTAPVSTPLENQADCGPPPGHWESLCPDVRRLVLSKVSFRDLVLAGTCREFRGEFLQRLGEERERLISLPEASYGKGVVSGFVKSVQDSICCSDPYYDQKMKHKHYLVIDAAGEHKRVTFKTVIRLLGKGCVATFARHFEWGTHVLWTDRRRRSGRLLDNVTIRVMRTGAFGTRIEASITRGTGRAGMGILLAICTRKHEPLLSRARRHSESPKTVPAVIEGSSMRKEFSGPLGALANTFFLYPRRFSPSF